MARKIKKVAKTNAVESATGMELAVQVNKLMFQIQDLAKAYGELIAGLNKTFGAVDTDVKNIVARLDKLDAVIFPKKEEAE